MEHIGIDLGGRESQVCVRDGNGGVVAEAKVPTAELGEFLKRRPSAMVVLETCAEAFTVADAARQAAHEVRVVPAPLVRALGVGARGVKTDVHDARLLSLTLLCWMPASQSAENLDLSDRLHDPLAGANQA